MIPKPTKLGPVSKQTIKELDTIVYRIKQGLYHHDQSLFHCGTAHCIAGFKQMMDYAKEKHLGSIKFVSTKVVTDDFRLFLTRWAWYKAGQDACATYFSQNYSDPFNIAAYAGRAWGLTVYESKYLFNGTRTLESIQVFTDLLSQGFRLVVEYPESIFDDPDTIRNRMVDPAAVPEDYLVLFV